jgi:hypothetical protein
MTFDQSAPQPEAVAPVANVLVGIDLNPPVQNRLTVFFRGWLVIPLALVQVVLSIPLYVVFILSWFTAVVTGRVPNSFHRFMTNFHRFSANVSAYQFLLIPKWPGINFNPRADEQVSLAITNEKQRRLSIFFRGLLIYPAYFLAVFWIFTHVLLALVTWVWVLIKGRAPRSLHQYGALWLRYNVRLGAYAVLLTSSQPWQGLRGDGVVTAPAPLPPEMVDSASVAQGTSLSDVSLNDDLEPGEAEANDAKPTEWTVVPQARTLVNWSFPIGGVLLVVYLVLIISLAAGKVSPSLQVTNSYDATYAVAKTFATSVQGCASITCLNQAAQTAYSGQAQAVGMLTGGIGGSASSAYASYSADVRNLANYYLAMSNAKSVTTFRPVIVKWQADIIKVQPDELALKKLIG